MKPRYFKGFRAIWKCYECETWIRHMDEKEWSPSICQMKSLIGDSDVHEIDEEEGEP